MTDHFLRDLFFLSSLLGEAKAGLGKNSSKNDESEKKKERKKRLFQNDCTKTGYRYGASPRLFFFLLAAIENLGIS